MAKAAEVIGTDPSIADVPIDVAEVIAASSLKAFARVIANDRGQGA